MSEYCSKKQKQSQNESDLINEQRKHYGYLSKVNIYKTFWNSRQKEEIINKDFKWRHYKKYHLSNIQQLTFHLYKNETLATLQGWISGVSTPISTCSHQMETNRYEEHRKASKTIKDTMNRNSKAADPSTG